MHHEGLKQSGSASRDIVHRLVPPARPTKPIQNNLGEVCNLEAPRVTALGASHGSFH